MRWAQADLSRDQLVLFATKLDDILPQDHPVRYVDWFLQRQDWSALEATYHGRLGQPPIHPRILASILLYGLMCQIRVSRKLEEALQMRADFRWLAHGMSIDHSTLSEFRRKHPRQIRQLFVQSVLIARELELVKFDRIGFDGTRVRANNRRTGTRTPEQLRRAKEELQEEFDRLMAKAEQQEAADEETFGGGAAESSPKGSLAEQMVQLEQAQRRVDAALAELEAIEQTTETLPARLPITDPQSRFNKTKEGGFAPCYTPTATVDIDSGIIVDQGVIAQSNESSELMATIRQVQEDYALEEPVAEVLADGLMATGENLTACEELGVDLISPVPGASTKDNPAHREDPSKPVPAERIADLPSKQINGQERFDKRAFTYDAERDVYWCPAGKPLEHSSKYQTTSSGKTISRDRYRANRKHCAGCPLAQACLGGQSKARQIDRGEHEDAIDRQVDKMKQPSSAERYSRRRHAGERPFAVIKQVFGLRQFLTRGLDSVRQEWCWASMAFNLHRLLAPLASMSQPP